MKQSHDLSSRVGRPRTRDAGCGALRLLAGLLLLLVAGSSPAQVASLAVGNGFGSPGEIVELGVLYTSTAEATAVQLDLVFDPAVLAAGTPLAGAGLAGHRIEHRLVAAGRLRLIVVSADLEPLAAGQLLLVPWTIDPGADPGRTVLALEAVVLADAAGLMPAPLAISPGTLEVVEAEDVVFGDGFESGDTSAWSAAVGVAGPAAGPAASADPRRDTRAGTGGGNGMLGPVADTGLDLANDTGLEPAIQESPSENPKPETEGDPVAEIPTLSVWGLGALGIAVVALGLLVLVRRGRIVVPGIVLATLLAPAADAQVFPGDANGDGVFDLADIAAVVDHILEKATAPGLPDCNQDTVVDVLDLVCLYRVFDAPPPEITGLDPGVASVGSAVRVDGQGFVSATGFPPRVTLGRQGGGTVEAPVTAVDPTGLTLTVPPTADSGLVTVVVPGHPPTVSPQSLTVLPASDFELSATPAATTLLPGQSAAYAVTLGSDSGFGQLATLAVEGLPAGIDHDFAPARITAGQTAMLSLTAPPSQPPIAVPLTVRATATVDGFELVREVGVELEVVPVATAFLGRTVVADTLQTPLAGVTVSFLGRDGDGNATGCDAVTTSDGGGNFALLDLPAVCAGMQLVRYDGSSATAPPGVYAGVDLIYELVEGQATASPVLVHLPRIDTAETVLVEQDAASDQEFTFATIPGLSATVYAGTVLSLADGSQPDPFPLVAIQVPVDRLPEEMPADDTMVTPFIVAFQPANATASQPVAVSYPNVLETPPGLPVTLTTLDPTRGTMVNYGTGTVSDDGTQIVPDLDPAHPGHRYGLVHFDWHGSQNPPAAENPSRDRRAPCFGDPVDVSSGVFVLTEVDLAISGPRGTVRLERTLRTRSLQPGPFGPGSSHNYDWRLDTNDPQASAVVGLRLPDGNAIPFVRRGGDTLTHEATPSLRGAVLRDAAAGTMELRWPDGMVFRFVPSIAPLGSVLESITDPNGNQVRLIRDPLNPFVLRQIVDPVQRRLTLEYDGENRITRVVDPIGRAVSYTYDAQGALETVTDPAGGVTFFEHETPDRLLRITDPRGVVVAENTYDANRRVITQQLADGGMLHFEYTLFNPDIADSPVQETRVTDPRGNVTTHRFSPQGFVLSVTDALGQTRDFEHQPGSNLLLAIRGAGACQVCGATSAGDVAFTYDAMGNVLTETNALGETVTRTYEPEFNRVLTETDPLGNTTTFTYDARGNRIATTDANGNTTTSTYDAHGQLLATTDPLGNTTTFGYDAMGDRVRATDALGNTTTTRYDALSRPVEVIDRRGVATQTVYDALGRIVETIDGRGHSVRFDYDAVGNLLALTDPRGHATAFTYDGMGRQLTRTTPGGRVETRSYDLGGNLVERIDRRGQTSQFVYDALDRLVEEHYQDSTVLRTYDPWGRLLEVEDSAAGLFAFGYDLVGRRLSAAGPFGTVLTEYDATGRVSRRQVVGQPAVDYQYDPVGNLLSAAMPEATVGFVYDDADRLTRLDRSNGVSTDYGYDPLSRVESIAHALGAQVLSAHDYTYDAEGWRTSQTTELAQSLVTQPFVATYDDENRLLTRNGITYAYDENGNRVGETGPDGTTTYTWDSRNRLVEILEPSGQRIALRYDPGGHLIEVGRAGLTERYLLDDFDNVVAIEAPNGMVSILTLPQEDTHLAVVGGDPAVELVLRDGLRSTVATVDGKGALVRQIGYEPFGATTAGSQPGFPFLYTGRPQVGGFYDFKARLYDPAAARFLSEDPIGFQGEDPNLFRYARNSPVSFIDPVGLLVTYAGGNLSIGATGFRFGRDAKGLNLVSATVGAFFGSSRRGGAGGGFFGTLGGGGIAGATLSRGLVVGLVAGDVEDLDNDTVSIGVAIPQGSVAVVLDGETNRPIGLEIGGPGLSLGVFGLANTTRSVGNRRSLPAGCRKR